jgi:glycosyltransferase involved in cell wall biosynthesis
MLPMSPWYFKPLTQLRIARNASYERKYAARFDRIIFVNREDASDQARRFAGASTDWVSSGMDATAFSPDPGVPRHDGMIVMTGNMFHAPNVDGVEYFCSRVFPLVRQRVENAILWLVGSRPAPAVKKWAADPHIKVTGFVPDVRPYLRQAMVSVCPVRLRIGTQTKVLEALACGTPVVTTSAGNHGIAGTSGEHLYVADDPQEFADRVVSLLQRQRWNELSQNGRRLVVENFTWEASTARLERIVEESIARRAAKGVSV